MSNSPVYSHMLNNIITPLNDYSCQIDRDLWLQRLTLTAVETRFIRLTFIICHYFLLNFLDTNECSFMFDR